MFLVTSLALGSCLRENNVCLLEGTTVFDDQLAASFSNYEKISCSTGPCKLDLPGDRVIPGVTTLSGVTVEGGTAFFDCGGTSNFEADSVTGKISISGCSSVLIQNSMVDADITTDSVVDGTFLSGSTLRLGSPGIGAGIGVEHGTATLQLSGGKASLYGDTWKIEGTGSVNIDNTRKVEYESGTEGITMLSWKWLEKHAEVVLQKFANKPESPVLFHKQNVTVMQNGWINGSSVTDSVVTGAVDYVPKIIGSRVSSDAHFSTDSVSDSVLDVTLYSRYEPLFFNNVSGKVSVATRVEFVNVWVPEGQTLDLTGTYSVDCPKCNRTFPVSERPSEPTDLFAPHLGAVGKIDLHGKTIVIGHTQKSLKPTARRSRRGLTCAQETSLSHGNILLTPKQYFNTSGECATSVSFVNTVVEANFPHVSGYTFGGCGLELTDASVWGPGSSTTNGFIMIFIGGSTINFTNVELTGNGTIVLDVGVELVLNGVRNSGNRMVNVFEGTTSPVSRPGGMLALYSMSLFRQPNPLKVWASSVSANNYDPNSNTYSSLIGPPSPPPYYGYQNGQVTYALLAVCDPNTPSGGNWLNDGISLYDAITNRKNFLSKAKIGSGANLDLECGTVCLLSLEQIYNSNRTCDTTDSHLYFPAQAQGFFGQCQPKEGTVVGPFFDPHTLFNSESVDFKRLRNAGFGTNTNNTPILAVNTQHFSSSGYNCYETPDSPSCVVYNYNPNPTADHTITLQYGDNLNFNPSYPYSELYYVFYQMPKSISITFYHSSYAKIYLLFKGDPETTTTLKVTTSSGTNLQIGCGVINSSSPLGGQSPTSINSTNMTSHFNPIRSGFGLTVSQPSEYGREYSSSGGFMHMDGYNCDMSTTTGTSSVSSSSGDSSTSEPDGSTTQSSGSGTSDNEDTAIIIGSVVGGVVLLSVIGFFIYNKGCKGNGYSRPTNVGNISRNTQESSF